MVAARDWDTSVIESAHHEASNLASSWDISPMSHSQPPPEQRGYGYPQAPTPPGWPGYPPTPPQAGDTKRKTIGIAVGALIVVGAIAGGFALFGGGGDGSETVPDDGKRYKLTAPDTVLGEYKVWGDSAQGQDRGSDQALLLGVSNGRQVINNWSTLDTTDPDSDFDNNKSIVFVGFYGDVDDPEKAVDAYFDIAQQGSLTSESIGSKEKQSPAGFKHGIMKCQYRKADAEPGQPDTTPLCVWGDHSSVGVVIVVDATKEKLSLEEGARIAADLRNETRVEIK
ncbi:BRI3 family protein [Streptomyces lonegramiae]|uniref:Serine/threonine protein kinase n=1 Tax=Streptomyces lonegramiae TaxID=3075524 RepID=A0ABU2XB97_9ACTN|nr:hypothetical protein [Streptomyces sp. DSM 41529]MDT0542395.1 hypothetical protein [Streptomyces sp. DSM 41529]